MAKRVTKKAAKKALEALGMRMDTIRRRLKLMGIAVPYSVGTELGCPLQQFFTNLYGERRRGVYSEIARLDPKNAAALDRFVRWNDTRPEPRRKRAA